MLPRKTEFEGIENCNFSNIAMHQFGKYCVWSVFGVWEPMLCRDYFKFDEELVAGYQAAGTCPAVRSVLHSIISI